MPPDPTPRAHLRRIGNPGAIGSTEAARRIASIGSRGRVGAVFGIPVAPPLPAFLIRPDGTACARVTAAVRPARCGG